jgi:hypothetical protein
MKRRKERKTLTIIKVLAYKIGWQTKKVKSMKNERKI